MTVAAGAVAVLVPFVWMLGIAFRTSRDLYADPARIWPGQWTLHGFTAVLTQLPFARLLLNTFVFAGRATLLLLLFDSTTAFALARLRFRGQRVFFGLVLATLMVPFQVTLVPVFLTVFHLGLLNTERGLILPRATSALGIFLLRQFFRQLPRDLDEAGDDFVDGVVATCDAVAARKRSGKRIGLSFDEWNVWDEQRPSAALASVDAAVPGRLIEETYTVLDAVVLGGLLMSLLRHSDRVRIACLAQLVNVIAPIRTEPDTRAWRQTTYHPFALTARYARGDVLRVEPVAPVLSSPTLGDIPAVDVVVTRNPTTGEMAVFALNRDDTALVSLELRLTDAPTTRVVEHLVIGRGDLTATDTRELPDAVVPRPNTGTQMTGRTLSIPLPPAAWTLIRTEPVAT